MRFLKLFVFCCLLIFFSACSNSTQSPDPEEVYDPIESVNRGIFEFNDVVDIYFLEPVARGYEWLTPNFFRTGVSNFFQNLDFPKHLASDLVQLKLGQAVSHTGRFIINSTLGVGGVWDAADDLFGLEHVEADMGIAFGYHGVGSGPYLVLPFLGPSNVRDALGRGIEVVLNPLFWLDQIDDMTWETDAVIQVSARGLDIINTRAGLLEAVDTAKEASLDYYAFVRKAYQQQREAQISGEPVEDDELAEDDWLDEEEEEDFE